MSLTFHNMRRRKEAAAKAQAEAKVNEAKQPTKKTAKK